MSSDNTDFTIRSEVSDRDLKFEGNDGGSVITALTLDMSSAGKAIFNAGLAIGGTGDANTLDDYEEGTWTPDVANDNSSDNFSTRIGKYTKIGQQVVVNFICDAGNSGTAGTQVRLSGLPFAVENGSAAMMIGSILANGGNNNNGGIISDGRLMDGGSGQTNQVTFITGMLSYRTTA